MSRSIGLCQESFALLGRWSDRISSSCLLEQRSEQRFHRQIAAGACGYSASASAEIATYALC
jgi:hypothetical protein